MCGICGYTGPVRPGVIERMTERLRHRGPDAMGYLEDADVHLGIRRLRVVDLETGDQPIWNEDGTVGIVFNGEIYGHASLREELERAGHRFRTRSDTEVIVHLYEAHGIAGLSRLNGMFALAIHDVRRRRLVVARDAVGVKPLLYHWNGAELVFASEAKSVLAHPGVTPELDPDALHLLLNIRFVPGPRTLFRGIAQLPPGHALVLEDGRLELVAFHRWVEVPDERMTAEDAAQGFRDVLRDAVARQLVADVPVGIFLSGGLDSSAVLAAAAASGAEQLRTFTLGFGEPTDELDDARRVAQHFGTEHHETTLSARPLELYPRVVWHAEQPKVNAPQGYYLSRFARQQVTVALSGLGGDELFLGYDIYRYLRPVAALGRLPRWLMAPGLAAGGLAADLLAGKLRGENARRSLELLSSSRDPLRAYTTLRNGWDLSGAAAAARLYDDSWAKRIQVTTREALAPLFDRPDRPLLEQVAWAELRGKMVDDFLLNDDRMSMANSLEVRVPLLDLEVVRFALTIPLSLKLDRGRLKAVMKQALRRDLPPETLRKRKWGFTFNPYEQFRKDLRALALRELSPAFLRRQGIVRPEFVAAILEMPPSPLLRWHYFMLWQLLGLKLWQEIFIEGREPVEIEERLAA